VEHFSTPGMAFRRAKFNIKFSTEKKTHKSSVVAAIKWSAKCVHKIESEKQASKKSFKVDSDRKRT
jgi:hypothetical protein